MYGRHCEEFYCKDKEGSGTGRRDEWCENLGILGHKNHDTVSAEALGKISSQVTLENRMINKRSPFPGKLRNPAEITAAKLLKKKA